MSPAAREGRAGPVRRGLSPSPSALAVICLYKDMSDTGMSLRSRQEPLATGPVADGVAARPRSRRRAARGRPPAAAADLPQARARGDRSRRLLPRDLRGRAPGAPTCPKRQPLVPRQGPVWSLLQPGPPARPPPSLRRPRAGVGFATLHHVSRHPTRRSPLLLLSLYFWRFPARRPGGPGGPVRLLRRARRGLRGGLRRRRRRVVLGPVVRHRPRPVRGVLAAGAAADRARAVAPGVRHLARPGGAVPRRRGHGGPLRAERGVRRALQLPGRSR